MTSVVARVSTPTTRGGLTHPGRRLSSWCDSPGRRSIAVIAAGVGLPAVMHAPRAARCTRWTDGSRSPVDGRGARSTASIAPRCVGGTMAARRAHVKYPSSCSALRGHDKEDVAAQTCFSRQQQRRACAVSQRTGGRRRGDAAGRTHAYASDPYGGAVTRRAARSSAAAPGDALHRANVV